MSQRKRQLALNVFVQRFGHHVAAWRHPSSTDNGRPDLNWYINAARLAEAAKFDAFFMADFIGRPANLGPDAGRNANSYQFEPFTLLSALATHTNRIGLIATVNTNYDHPYNLARRFSSLDHISGGRAGWNIVSSFSPHTAENFGINDGRDHGERYERAGEFVELSKSLWNSWDDDAFDHPDRVNGRFYNPESAHPVHFNGEHLKSDAILDLPRPIQGYPVFVQAGNSETGREFAAKHAEMIYASATSLDVAKTYYADVKRRLAKYGRDESQLIVTPGLSVVVGSSDQEAQDKFGELQSRVDFSELEFGGFDLSKYDLDGPLPDLPYKAGENGQGRFLQQLELARRENLTIRQLVLKFRVARGHVQAIGSPKTIADLIEKWFVEKGADGFNVVPPYLPSGFVDFVNLVVPELQRRGIFRKEYEGKTLRDHLGLDRPDNPNTQKRHPHSLAA
ncbi:FMN-dependent oxidoreductase (nitrilotriacetate monooxygenase family) [Limnobacter thiooxidans]|uniref:LLM class flavin-dependent oxidoreductase n=1 Tax=Limnobacter thiooxidans TaxID=131080 RepID=A0AA86JLS4_9BURK|nr:FMN-dependent oxidoreductase (nitrilotriacetate monooxygenase family) [Limnobacter thiooxidans]BET26992.1 LLM class flavin-dependent oxidoreductase [Limnobacter thiooxidans]